MKALIFALKIVVMVILVAWVLNQVEWDDYVVGKEVGETYAVQEARPSAADPAEIVVREGPFWNRSTRTAPTEEFQTAPDSQSPVRRGFRSVLLGANWPLLTLGLALYLLAFVLVGVRWWWLLRIASIQMGLFAVERLTFLGLFFNNVVPGTVGGDLVKAYYVARGHSRKTTVLVSVFADRAIGLFGLLVLCILMLAVVLVFGLEPLAAVQQSLLVACVLLVLMVFAAAVALSTRVRNAMHLQALYSRRSFRKAITAAGDAVRLYRRHFVGTLVAVLMAILAHISMVGAVAALGASLDLATPWYSYFVYVPLIYVVGAVPLTPGGVGVIESLYIGFFGSAAVLSSTVLAVALLDRVIRLLWSLLGAIVIIREPNRSRRQSIEEVFETDGALDVRNQEAPRKAEEVSGGPASSSTRGVGE